MQAESVRADLDFPQLFSWGICQPFGQSNRKGKFAAALERNHDQPTWEIIASGLRDRSTRHRRRTARVRCFKLIFSNCHELPSRPSTTVAHGYAVIGPSGSLPAKTTQSSHAIRSVRLDNSN